MLAQHPSSRYYLRNWGSRKAFQGLLSREAVGGVAAQHKSKRETVVNIQGRTDASLIGLFSLGSRVGVAGGPRGGETHCMRNSKRGVRVGCPIVLVLPDEPVAAIAKPAVKMLVA